MELTFLDAWFVRAGVVTEEIRVVLILFSIIFVTALASYMTGRILQKLKVQVERTNNLWDDTLILAALKPAKFLVWVLGGTFALSSAEHYYGVQELSFVEPLRQIGVIFSLSWFLVKFVSHAERILVSPEKVKQPMDQTTVSAIGKLLRASIIITSVLVVLQTLGYSVSGVLAFGGIGGIAVGFAAKDLLANFFGGLMVYLDRPFSVGDWVRSPDKNIEGTVEHIGWRTTCIRTFEKRPIYVPNSTFTSITVENPSRMSHRRIYETIGVRYDDGDKVERILSGVKEMLLAHDEIDTTQTLIVNFNAFGPSSLDFFIYTFTKTTNWIKYHEVKQDVLLRIMRIIESEGAEIAYPTRTLHHVGVPQFAGMETSKTTGKAMTGGEKND